MLPAPRAVVQVVEQQWEEDPEIAALLEARNWTTADLKVWKLQWLQDLLRGMGRTPTPATQ